MPTWVAPAFVAMLAIIVILCVYLSPPSHNHYNPDHTISNVEDSKSLAVLPRYVDIQQKTEKKIQRER